MTNKIDLITAFEGFVCNFTPCCTSDEYHLELFKKVLELLKEQKNLDDEIQSLRKENNDIYKQFHEWIKSIVKCKYCKKRYTMSCGYFYHNGEIMPDNWFCADGERKET